MNPWISNQCHGTARRLAARTVAVAATLLLAASAHAGDWRYSITPYAWATDIGIDTRLAGRTLVDAQIPVSDLLEDLDTIFQMRVEAMHDHLGVSLDVFDVTMSDQVRGAGIPNVLGSFDLDSDIGMTILDLAGVYEANVGRPGLSILAGTRILDQRATMDATFTPTAGTPGTQHYTADETLADALFGFRVGVGFARHWAVRTQADVSTGGTDHTWSVAPTLNYAFGRQNRFGVSAGYRRMDIDFKDEGGLDTQLSLSGVLVGFRTSF